MKSGFYRAKFTFIDEDWCNEKLVSYFIPKGTVIHQDHDPNPEFWEAIHMYTGTDSVLSDSREFQRVEVLE